MTFDFAEGLIRDNLLFVDRETHSLWSQLQGKAVSGPLADAPLRIVPSVQTTWRTWRTQHPDTRVAVLENARGRPYWYRDRTQPRPPGAPRPSSHDVSKLGLGLVIRDEAVFFPLRTLVEHEAPVHGSVGGVDVTVHHAADGLSAWAMDAAGNLLPAVTVYEEAWREFFPETSVFTGR